MNINRRTIFAWLFGSPTVVAIGQESVSAVSVPVPSIVGFAVGQSIDIDGDKYRIDRVENRGALLRFECSNKLSSASFSVRIDF